MKRKRRQKPVEQLQAEVDRFNQNVPEGAPVRYRSSPGADPIDTVTRSDAWLLSGHTGVVLIEGVSGAVALEAIETIKQGGG